MSFSEELKKSILDHDLAKFTELANHPALLVNEIYGDGLLHYLLTVPSLPLEFYKVVLVNLDVDVNKIGANKLPPILSTENPEIQDLLLAVDSINVNIEVLPRTNMRLINIVLKAGDLKLFQKLLDHPRTDYSQRKTFLNEDQTLLNYAMTNNMEAFKMLLDKGVDPNRSGPYNPVEFAVRNSNFEAFRMLLEKGAEFNLFFRARGISLMNYLLEFGFLKGSDIKMLDLIFDTYFDKIRDKKELLEKSMNLENVQIFQRLLDKGLRITDDLLPLLMSKHDQLKIVLARPDMAGVSKEIIAALIFKSEDIELVEILSKTSFTEDIESIIVETLLECENADVLRTIINSNIDYLQTKNILPHILVGNKGHMFDMLVQGGEADLVDILLELAPETKIPPNFPPISTLIAREKYELLDLLMKKYGVYLDKQEQFELLLKKGKLDVLKTAFESCSHNNLKLLFSTTFFDVYQKLPLDFAIELLFDEKVKIYLWTNAVMAELYKIPGFIRAIEDNIDRYTVLSEKHGRLNMKWLTICSDGFSFDSIDHRIKLDSRPDTPIVRILQKGDTGVSQVNRMITILPIEEKYEICEIITRGLIIIGNVELLERFTDIMNRNNIQINDLLIDYLLAINPLSIMSNIDALKRLIPSLRIQYIPVFRSCIDANPDLFVSSGVARKLMTGDYSHSEMVIISSRFRHDDDSYHTQLYELCRNIDVSGGKSTKLDAYLDLIRTYLENPESDVNQRNDIYTDVADEYHEDNVTILEYCAIQIKSFDNSVDYNSAESYGFYQQVIKMLLANSRLDIDSNNNLFPIILREEEGVNLEGLLTTILSHPTIDINSTNVIFNACYNRNILVLSVLLTIGSLNVNRTDEDGNTPLHICIEKTFDEGALALLADPRIDITIQDAQGRNYARLAGKAGMRRIVERLSELGQTDDKQARVEREIAEYDARMAAQGRVKQTRIRETLNSFDLILKEKRADREDMEDDEGGFRGSTTPYSRSMCPFCLTYIEKENPYECVYLAGHRCPAELENEPLKRLYFGDQWQTKEFEVCCVCGRPCEHHGHFRPTIEGEPVSELLPNRSYANHWDCNEGNGGGGKLEMTCRLLGMLSEIKRRVDSEERLVYGPELIRELSMIGNSSIRDEAIKARAVGVLERQGWNSNSKIEKYKKFNAPAANAANNNSRPRNVREPIVHYDNPEEQLHCMICLDEAEHLFKPHESDEGYICDECLKRQVCASRYASVTCELGCRPKKQIYKEDVNALMGGNFCEGVEIAEAHANADEE